MHPVLSSARALFWYLLSWLLGAALLAGVLAQAEVAPWRNALWFATALSVGVAFVMLSAYDVCRAVPFTRRRLGAGLVLFASASSVAGAVVWGLSQSWNWLSLALDVEWAGFLITPTMGWSLFAVGALAYLLSLLLHDVMLAFSQVREAQRRELLSQGLAREAELQMLRTQINPHFLFNCLNSISALTSMDGAAARAMTIALAQYFRQTLSMSEQTSIPLAQEIAHCQCFLDIEMQRFGGKLAVQIALPDDAQAARVPPMILQPLVENAVKHGIAQSTAGGTVDISAQVRNGWLHLCVTNPLEPGAAQPPRANTNQGMGLGLKNSRQRLLAIYGDQARMVQRATPQRFVVELTLPFTTLAHGATGP